jgi:hypothetical protein
MQHPLPVTSFEESAMTVRLPVFAATLIVHLALGAGIARAEERYSLPGHDVAIWNIAGTSRIERGTGSEVIVTVERGGSDGDRLTVRTGPVRGRSGLRVITPASRVVYRALPGGSRTSVRLRADGTFGEGSDLFGRTVVVTGRGGGFEGWADLRVQVPPDRTVSVYTAAGAMSATNVDGTLRLDTGAGSVQAAGCTGRLVADTGSGPVTVSDHDGALLVDTGSGDVSLDDVHGPSVVVDTGSGSVLARGVSTPELRVDTGSGDVQVESADASRVVVDTGSGSVWMSLLHRSPDVLVDTGSGAVDLAMRGDASADLYLETGSGVISCDLPLTNVRREHGTLSGSLLDGRGRVRVDTGSGGIRLVRATGR